MTPAKNTAGWTQHFETTRVKKQEANIRFETAMGGAIHLINTVNPFLYSYKLFLARRKFNNLSKFFSDSRFFPLRGIGGIPRKGWAYFPVVQVQK